MRPLFHIIEAGGWPASGAYWPESLASQGFVHLSFADQVQGSANRFYADAQALDVVEVDPERFEAPVVVEDTYGSGASFPHVYAPLPASAAIAVRRLRRVAGQWSFPVVRVSAVVLRDARLRVLSVRKRGTSSFMFPGGKPEPGESATDAAVRELAEELTVALRADELRELGVFAADAANEAGHLVEGTIFLAPDVDVTAIRPAAEIAELRWDALDDAEDGWPADLALLSARVYEILRDRDRRSTLIAMADENEGPIERPATWENEVVGKATKWIGKVTHDKELVEEGEEQDEIAHEVHEEYRKQQD